MSKSESFKGAWRQPDHSADLRVEYGGGPFSTLLDAYLDLRARGPIENNGYTDKDYYRRMDVLRELLDERAPLR